MEPKNTFFDHDTYPEGRESVFREFRELFPDLAAYSRGMPAMYDVVILNDDLVPSDYIMTVLEDVFHLEHEQAAHMMLLMQQHGEVICGTYTRDVAETKMISVVALSREHSHPLRCVIRKEVE